MSTVASVRDSLLAKTDVESWQLTDENDNSNASSRTTTLAHSQLKSYKLRRFPLRATAAILGPLVVLAYYVFICRLLWSRNMAPGKILYGYSNEQWIHYSWFVVGVFGLNFSKYGLQGVEASMLHESRWQAKNTMKLLMRCESAWGGPGGWLKCVKAFLQRRKNPAGRLWYALAFLSFCPFIALPLSGLTLELGEGYVQFDESSTISSAPMVIGHTPNNFNRRPRTERGKDVFWETGFPPTIPGFGLVYTDPHVQRDSFPFLREIPNILPSDISEGNPDLFLSPQAAVPTSGHTWGLRIGYNCSIVKSFSEFTILPRRPTFRLLQTSFFGGQELRSHGGNDTIVVFGNKDVGKESNMGAYAELGWEHPGIYGSLTGGPAVMPNTSGVGLRPSVLEYALWQTYFFVGYSLGENLPFNKTIVSPIEDAPSPYFQTEGGSVHRNETFFRAKSSDLDGDDSNSTILISRRLVSDPSSLFRSHIAPPIGVRCIRHSKLGYANIHWDGTFRSFNESWVPPVTSSHETGTQFAFGFIASTLIEKIQELLTSTNSPPALDFAHGIYYPGYIQAETLYSAVMKAHAWNAIALMYDNTYTFESAHASPNTTGSRLSKIIVPGDVPPIVPLFFFVPWIVGSLILGCTYGFRRRWSETLDGYSMFRFGADFSSEILREPDFVSTRGFAECESLRRLPGLVGDSQPMMDIGHISLVERGKGNGPRKGKKYH